MHTIWVFLSFKRKDTKQPKKLSKIGFEIGINTESIAYRQNET